MLHGRMFSLLWFNLCYYRLGIIYFVMIITSRKNTIHEIPILYRYDRPSVRVYQIASKSIWQKVLHCTRDMVIKLWFLFSITLIIDRGKIKQITQSEVCVSTQICNNGNNILWCWINYSSPSFMKSFVQLLQRVWLYRTLAILSSLLLQCVWYTSGRVRVFFVRCLYNTKL